MWMEVDDGDFGDGSSAEPAGQRMTDFVNTEQGHERAESDQDKTDVACQPQLYRS